MRMPTPCSLCNELEEFDNMKFVEGVLSCIECYANAHVCNWCENLVISIRKAQC